MEKSANIANLAKSLVAASKHIDAKVLKNAVNESFGSGYANLGAIIDAVKPSLMEVGIVVLQSPTVSERPNEIRMTTLLLHETGEWLEDTCTCPLEFFDPQAFGSAVTYVRRYALASLLLLHSADDDGQSTVRADRNETKVHSKSAADPNSAVSNAATPSGDGDASDIEALPPAIKKRVTSWLNTIANASLKRLETSRASAKTTFSDEAFKIVDKAFGDRIDALRAAPAQPV